MRLCELNLYAPWLEPPEQLRSLHQGRNALLTAARDAISRFLAGDNPLPMYLFGPPGVGKSHLLALLRVEFPIEDLVFLSESVPLQRSAAHLLQRIADPQPGGLTLLSDSAPPLYPSRSPQRVIALVEGLDRQLLALGQQERRELRRLLGERAIYLIATGEHLNEAFTGREEAFYGAFDPWPVEALSSEEARALLDALLRANKTAPPPGWPQHQEQIIALTRENTRALVALGASLADEPKLSLQDHLQRILRLFTPYYQMRFRGLSPQAQSLIELLARSTPELTPTEMAARLQSSPTQISVLANRLVEDSLLDRRRRGRQSWYRMKDSIFSYWMSRS